MALPVLDFSLEMFELEIQFCYNLLGTIRQEIALSQECNLCFLDVSERLKELLIEKH